MLSLSALALSHGPVFEGFPSAEDHLGHDFFTALPGTSFALVLLD